MSLEWIGWAATAAFAASYLCRNPRSLRLVQALSALLWVGYGALIGAWPVIVANVVVAAAAGWTSLGRRREPAG
jgi:hypothetical protein